MTGTTNPSEAPALAITPQEKGHAIAFPFELKDRFRAAFPRARWDPHKRVWTVGPRSRARLEAWADEVRSSGILDDLATRDERDLSARELDELRVALSRLRFEIGKAEEARREAEKSKAACAEVRAALDAGRRRLEEVRSVAAEAERERDEAEAALWARLHGIVDRVEIEHLRRQMLRTWQPKACDRARFKPLQERMREIRDAMHGVGVTSQAVRLAAEANFNRPDRDRPDLSVPIELEIYDEEE
jgi:hypothetical protein